MKIMVENRLAFGSGCLLLKRGKHWSHELIPCSDGHLSKIGNLTQPLSWSPSALWNCSFQASPREGQQRARCLNNPPVTDTWPKSLGNKNLATKPWACVV